MRNSKDVCLHIEDMEVLLRILPLLVLSVFIDPDSKACELTGDLKTSIIFIRYNRSFSDAAKIANFSFIIIIIILQ
jgi:hypothetical protein